MKRWLVEGSHGEKIIITDEDTASGAAYAAADRHGMAEATLHVTELVNDTKTFHRGWVDTT